MPENLYPPVKRGLRFRLEIHEKTPFGPGKYTEYFRTRSLAKHYMKYYSPPGEFISAILYDEHKGE